MFLLVFSNVTAHLMERRRHRLKQKPQTKKGILVNFLLFKNIFRPKRMSLTIP